MGGCRLWGGEVMQPGKQDVLACGRGEFEGLWGGCSSEVQGKEPAVPFPL